MDRNAIIPQVCSFLKKALSRHTAAAASAALSSSSNNNTLASSSSSNPTPHPSYIKPLVVGIQAPQGFGKSTLCAAVEKEFYSGDAKYPGVVALSLDDFYKTHAELTDLYKKLGNSKLFEYRGNAGT